MNGFGGTIKTPWAIDWLLFKWNTKPHYNSHFFIIRRPIWSVEDNFYTVRRIIYLNLLEMAGWWPSHARQADSAGEAMVSLFDLLQQWKFQFLRAPSSKPASLCSPRILRSAVSHWLHCYVTPGQIRKPRKICKIFVANPAFPFIPRFKVKGFQLSWLLCSTKCKSHPSLCTGIQDWT